MVKAVTIEAATIQCRLYNLCWGTLRFLRPLVRDYRATKSQEELSWGSNVDDLSAWYFHASVALPPTPTSPSKQSEGRVQCSQEFCFRWKFSANGLPNRLSCPYKHFCIHCPQQRGGKHFPASETMTFTPSIKNSVFAALEATPSSNSFTLVDCLFNF